MRHNHFATCVAAVAMLWAGGSASRAQVTIKTSAGIQIEIMVGDSKITINPVMIKLEALLIDIEASAMLKLQGGIVMIN